MSLHSLPLFVRMAGRPVILIGQGKAADAKRRLLERAGADIVDENNAATLAIVAIDDEEDALAAVARLKARGVLVNAVDRPDHCDFTLPAIVDRSPVIVAVGTGGVSAGLAAALRQRLETLLPAQLGDLAEALLAARPAMRERWPDAGDRRRALAAAMSAGGAIDPLGVDPDVDFRLADLPEAVNREFAVIRPRTPDPDDLTLREARLLAGADRVYHRRDIPNALLDRARADADRIAVEAQPIDTMPGFAIYMEMAR